MLTKDTEGWGGRSWQTTCTCKGGEEEPAWEQCGWTEDCRSGSQEVTFHTSRDVLITING